MSKSKVLEKIGLLIIIIFSAILYLYKLDTTPSLYVDEAVVGYNAYSILNTGLDEYGKSFPVAFRFFGSYTPPLFVYLSVPFIKIFGLNVFSIRFVSVLSGLLNIFLVYLFIKNLKIFKTKYIALLAAFLFSFLPWSLYNSRLGYEVNLAFTFFILGALFFLKSISNNPKYLIFGVIALSASSLTAHTERYLVPLFIILFLIFFKKTLLSKNYRKFLLWSFFVFILTQLPNLFLMTQKAFWVKTEYLNLGNQNIFTFIYTFFEQIFRYYSPKNLFLILQDSHPQRTIPSLSMFYFWMMIPYLFGLYHLWYNRKSVCAKFILLLLICCPIPAALEINTFSIQRAIPILLPVFILIILGVDYLFLKLSKMILIPVFTLLSLVSLVLLYRSYFIFLPQERAKAWNYGYQELAQFIKNNPQKQFVINRSNDPAIYINLLFFLRYPPQELQQVIGSNIKDNYYSAPQFDPDYKFSNIEIRPISWKEDNKIIVGDDLAISPDQIKEHNLKPVFEIKDPMNKLILQAFIANRF